MVFWGASGKWAAGFRHWLNKELKIYKLGDLEDDEYRMSILEAIAI